MTQPRSIILALFVIAAAVGLGAGSASAEMTVLYQLNTDTGKFGPAAVYDVDPATALAAFDAEASGPETGPSLYHNGGAGIPEGGGAITSSTPAEGFADFLAAHYQPLPTTILPPCDEDFIFQYILECPFQCEPDPTECNENVWIGYTITCLGIPPCPVPLICRDFPTRLVGVITDVPACFCQPGDSFCAQDEAAVVVNLITTGPLCECDGSTSTETSGWGRVKNLFR